LKGWHLILRKRISPHAETHAAKTMLFSIVAAQPMVVPFVSQLIQ
jgi:hypothetical protein